LFLFHDPLGKLNAQQTILQLKSIQAEKTILDLYDRGFLGLSNAMAWKSLSESNFSRLYEKSTLDKFKLIHILNGLQRGEEYAVNLANETYSKADESAKQLLSFSLSQYYFNKADYTNVIEQFNNTDPTYFSNEINEQIQLQRGVAYFSLKQFTEAKPFFQSIIQLGNSQYLKIAHYYLGFIAFSKNAYSDAYDHFKLLMTDSYYNTVVPFYISYILYLEGDTNRAIEIAEQYLVSQNAFHLIEAKQLLATIYFNKGDFSKSNHLYESLLASKQVLIPIQSLELGVGYLGVGDYKKSIVFLKPLASGNDSLSAQSLFFLANAFLNLGDKKQARNSFSLSLSMPLLSENREMASFNYAKLSLELGFKDEGIKKMNEFVKSYPKSSQFDKANEILLDFFSRTNDYIQAVKLLETYPGIEQKVKPLAQRIYFGRALEFINQSNFDMALKYIDAVLGHKSGQYYYPALYWQGEVYQRQKLFQQSVNSFTAYLKGQSKPFGIANSTNANYGLAIAYYELGSYSNALEYFDKLRLNKSISDVKLKEDCLLKAADCALMLNDFSKATLLYSYTVKEFNNDYAAFQIAIIKGLNDPFEKVSLLNSIEKTNPKTTLLPKITLEIADTYIAEEKYELALPYLNKLMLLVKDKDEYYSQALLKLGVVYFNLDRPDDALIQYKKILTNFPSSEIAKDAMESAKTIYIESGRVKEFSEFLSMGGIELASFQKDSLTYQFVQKKFLDTDNISAFAAIESYLKDFPKGLFVSDVLNFKVQLLRKDKKWNELIKTIDELLLEKGSRYIEQSLRLAASVSFVELKNYSLAKKYFEDLLNATISSEIQLESLKGLVRSDYHLRNWEGGSVHAEKLLKFDVTPDDQAYSNMIIGYQEQNNQLFELSSEYFNKVLNSSSTILKPEAAFQYSFNSFKSGDYSVAEKVTISLIEKYGSDDYWNTKCYILLGDIFIAEKDYFNARATLKSVSENTTSPDLRVEAIEKLKKLSELEQKNNSSSFQ
jgi:tetratricopeptide (TPR) repeat protein